MEKQTKSKNISLLVVSFWLMSFGIALIGVTTGVWFGWVAGLFTGGALIGCLGVLVCMVGFAWDLASLEFKYKYKRTSK